MTPIGVVHTTFSLVAVAAGGWLLRLPKGTRWHRTLGHVYATAMATTVATALGLYTLTGRWGPFHFAAIVGGFTLAGGLWTVLARRPTKEWIRAHAIWMSWSYIGLMAALVSESLTRLVMPRVAPHFEGTAIWTVFWATVVGGSVLVLFVGMWLVNTRLPGAIAGTPQAMRRDRDELRALESAQLP